ncbi:MAG: sulfotransferase [Pseudomonadota bacterium]
MSQETPRFTVCWRTRWRGTARWTGSPGALAGLLGVAEGEAREAAVRQVHEVLRTGTDRDAALVGYALGKALSRIGDHAGAWDAWSAANAARQREAGPFDRARFDRRVERMIELFSPAFFYERCSWGHPTERPVLVVGLPRSGTTLTERILGAHSAAYGAGELPDLTDLATGTPDRLGWSDPPWPKGCEMMSARAPSCASSTSNRSISGTWGWWRWRCRMRG